MQETLEVTRLSKNLETQVVSQTKKIFEWRDVISIEEADYDTLEEFEEDDIVLVHLTYDSLCVKGRYRVLRNSWLAYKEYVKEEALKLSNVVRQ